MLPKQATEKQKLFYKYALEHPYSILAVDPRLGKSMVGISIRQKLNNNCLIICPGYLVSNWPKEIKKWAPTANITTFKTGKSIYEPCDTDFVIISFDLIKKAEHLFEWADMVLIDEGHHLKSMPAKRTQFIHRCIYEYSMKRVHILTGTVIKNRVHEFYSLMALMYYDPKAKSDFLKKYPDEITFADRFSFREEFQVKIQKRTKKGKLQTYWMPVARWKGLRRIKELKSFLEGRYIRVKADEKDLPPIVYKTILISESPDKELLRAFNAFFDEEGSDSVKVEVKVQAAIKKVPFTIKYVEDLLENVDCVLVYSDHREPTNQIAAHFKVPAITGDMSTTRRSRLADEFQAGKGRVIVATIGSLKEGKDLFRARDIVISDLCWVPGDLKQVINRVRALGKKGTCTVHLISGSPQDKKIGDSLREKLKVIEAAT